MVHEPGPQHVPNQLDRGAQRWLGVRFAPEKYVGQIAAVRYVRGHHVEAPKRTMMVPRRTLHGRRRHAARARRLADPQLAQHAILREPRVTIAQYRRDRSPPMIVTKHAGRTRDLRDDRNAAPPQLRYARQLRGGIEQRSVLLNQCEKGGQVDRARYHRRVTRAGQLETARQRAFQCFLSRYTPTRSGGSTYRWKYSLF